MSVVINGTTGITSVNGSAAAPSVTGADTDTGIVYGTNTLSLATGGTTAVTVDSSQNVGIGTSSPSNLLHVSQASSDFQVRVTGTSAANAGAIRTYSAGGEASVFGTTGSSNAGYGASLGVLGTVTNIPQIFVTNNTERARIDTSGNLLVGRTTALAQIAATLAPIISTTGNGYSNYNGSTQVLFGGAIGNEGCWFTSGAFRVMNASQTGVYIVSGATSWSGSSDERLKTDLKPIQNAADKVSTLRAVTGRFKTDDENVSRSFLIAQDVQAVLPEAVNVQDDEQGTLGVQYTDVIPLLVAAIKEQQALITQLQADVAALKAPQ